MSEFPRFSAPADVGALKTFYIVSLVVHAVAALIWLLLVLKVGILTCGIGCVLVVVPAVLIAAIVFDSMALTKLDHPPSPAVYGTLKTAAIFDIVTGVIGFSVIPLVMGILCLMNLQKPEVQHYFTGFAPPTTPPPPPPPPAQTTDWP